MTERKTIESKVISSFRSLGPSPQGLAWVKGGLWIADGETSELCWMSEKGAVLSKFLSPCKSPRGLTWDGRDLLVLDGSTKIVHRIRIQDGYGILALDLTKTKTREETPLLPRKDTSATGIAFGKGSLWVSLVAGYSSSIYRINLTEQSVEERFWAHGPEPRGMFYDEKGGYLWVVDSSNREIRRLTLSGKLADVKIPTPEKSPTGLTLDEEGNLWIADSATRMIYKIKWGPRL